MRSINRMPALTVRAVSAGLALVAFAGTPVLAASARTPSAVKSAQAPIASFTAIAGVIHGKCGFIGWFNASASVAPAGTSITKYAWRFGDGGRLATTRTWAIHPYAAGSYHVVLTVTDSDGTKASASREISGVSGSPFCI